MRVVFGDAFDEGAWPGPLGSADGRSAVLDEVWAGVEGLTQTLEVRLGLLQLERPTQAERAAELARELRATAQTTTTATTTTTAQPWARSLAVDPLATARSLLRLRDALVEVGVDSDTDPARLPERLAVVHRATRGVLPGRVDRTRAVIAALEQGARARIDVVATVFDEEAATPLTRRLLRALEKGGAVVAPQALPRPIDDGGDLARARNGGTGYAGDGSLLLLRPDDAASAADEVACFLTADGGGAVSAVVIGADDGLDEALHRRGGATLGIAGVAGNDALLALLPLVIAVSVDHPDPDRLFELCALPLSPLPRPIAARVRSALLRTPSARAPAVTDAVEAGLLALLTRDTPDLGESDAKARNDRLRLRLKDLVPAWGGTPTDALSTPVLLERTAQLVRWLQGRQKREHGDVERTPYRAAIRQVSLCRRLLLQLDLPTLTPPQLLRLLESSTEGTRPLPRHDALAGHHKLRRPGTLCGPADVVVWWGFTQESARLARSPFTAAETRLLRDAGFAPSSAAARARAHARAERRPLDHTTGRLILCCPRRGDDGREQHPHPLWDELMARLPRDERRGAARALSRPEPGLASLVARETPLPRALPRPRQDWRIAKGSIAPADVTSPSSEERLLSCSFRAVLHERAVKPVRLHLPRGAQLEGQVVHALLATVLAARPPSAAAAADHVRAIFDETAVTVAGAWQRPGREQTRVRVRERAARAAQALVQLLLENSFSVVAVETEVGREFPGERTLKGTPDVVVDGPLGRMIIDHKTGNDRLKRQQLAQGTAVQLIDYTVIAGEKGKPWPMAGYFQLRSRRLLTTDPRVVGAEVIVGPRPKEAWAIVDAARQRAFSLLLSGELRAPAADGSSPAQHLSAPDATTPMQLEPPCSRCPYDVLCGRAFVAAKKR